MPLGLDFAVEEHLSWSGGAFKGPYKSESSLMTCEAELHGSVTRMVYSILSHIGTHEFHHYRNQIQVFKMSGESYGKECPSPFEAHLLSV